jgi:LPXTG-motif cell wall-anchored protein
VNEEPEVASKQSQDTAVKPAEKEVEIAQAVEPPPVKTTPTPQEEPAATPERTEQLPQTASQLPFWGLIGLLSLGAGLALMGVSKRRNIAR